MGRKLTIALMARPAPIIRAYSVISEGGQSSLPVPKSADWRLAGRTAHEWRMGPSTMALGPYQQDFSSWSIKVRRASLIGGFVPLTWRILLALVLGLGAGLIAARLDPQVLSVITSIAEPVGGIWVDALRMTIIPLVFGLVVNGIA